MGDNSDKENFRKLKLLLVIFFIMIIVLLILLQLDFLSHQILLLYVILLVFPTGLIIKYIGWKVVFK
jgi:cell division protein FtsW (lipid II flippase)